MSGQHCGEGLKRDNLETYLNAGSHDFGALTVALGRNGPRKGEGEEEGEEWRFGLGVATGSDPEVLLFIFSFFFFFFFFLIFFLGLKEYNLPGQSKETHILGPDLAREVIKRYCPSAENCFGLLIGLFFIIMNYIIIIIFYFSFSL